jgi:hypothetical protein
MSSVTLYTISVSLNAEFATSALSLQEISESVASEIISMVSLSKVSANVSFTYKEIDLPEAINNRGYIIKTEQDGATWKIVSHLNEFPLVKGEAELLFSTLKKQAITCQTNDEDAIINSGGRTLHLIKSSFLYSGTGKAPGSKYLPVIWCQVYDDIDGIQKIKIGFGRLEVS